MKFLLGTLIVISALAFGSCRPAVESYEIDALTRACEKHGGIFRIDTTIVNSAICRDGVRVTQKDGRK